MTRAGIGTLGGGVIRASGELDLDVAVGREFAIPGRVLIRAEALNAPNFGLIAGSEPPRSLQLVAGFHF